MAIKLVAFDWNGTLLADTTMNLECSNINFKKFGLKPISIQNFQKTFHIPVSNFWKAHGGKIKDLEKQAENFHKLYLERASKTRSRRGSKKILKWLWDNKIERIIYSNHTTLDIFNQLKRLKIYPYFSNVLGRNIKKQGHLQVHKRHKEDYLKNYVRKLRLKPYEVISVGDTEEEIEIGKALGYHTIAITGGYNTTARLKKHHPDFLIHNMKELVGIVKKLNKL
jgi:phosphoglycolate phosphatase-like HAD superfamily hydrolase